MILFRKNRLASLFLALFFIYIPSTLSAEQRLLLPGTPYCTPISIQQSSLPGPTVLILGGVHGDEPAGSLAAEELQKVTPKRGTILVIPRVNSLALAQEVRTLPHIGDMNRGYPGTPDGTVAEQIAHAIQELITEYKVTMLLDLHEGRSFHRLDKTSVGQTILFAANNRSTLLAMDATEHINKTIADRSKQFSLLAHPIPHSAAHFAAEKFGIAAFTVETAGTQPIEDRIAQHIIIARYLLSAEGVL